jgi:gas vesicle protein
MNDRDNIFSIIFPYLVGAAIGAAVALLMAPKSGQDTRHLIRSKSGEIKDRAVETVEDTRARAGKAIDDLTQQTKENLSSITHRAKDVVGEQKSRVEERI